MKLFKDFLLYWYANLRVFTWHFYHTGSINTNMWRVLAWQIRYGWGLVKLQLDPENYHMTIVDPMKALIFKENL